jgi:hypothetical protein
LKSSRSAKKVSTDSVTSNTELDAQESTPRRGAFWLKGAALACTLVLFAALAAASAYYAYWLKAPYAVELTLQRGKYQWLTGTFAEVKDEVGRVRLSVGVEDAYSSNFQSDPQRLKVQFDDGNDAFKDTVIPAASNVMHGTLFSLANQLYLRDSASDAFLKLNAEGNGWIPAQQADIYRAFCGKDAEFCSVVVRCDRIIGFNSAILLTRRCAAEQGSVVWAAFDAPSFLGIPTTNVSPVRLTATSLVLSYYNDEQGAEGLILCKRRDTGPVEESHCARVTYKTQDEFPYAISEDPAYLTVFSNNGSVVSFEMKTKAATFRREAGAPLEADAGTTSYQIYSTLAMQGETMLGGYPLTLVQSMDPRAAVRTFSPPLPSKYVYGEVQTLTWFKNRVLAGVWPWGQVWKFDPYTKDWSLMGRLFKYPDLEKLSVAELTDEPLAKQLQSNALGQRVNSFVSLGDSIYAIGSAKDNYSLEVAKESKLPKEQLDEYGAVHRLSTTGMLSVSLPKDMASGDKLRIELDETKLTVLYNGAILGTAELALKDQFCLQGIATGAGQFGAISGGTVSVSKLSGNLKCDQG